MPGTVNIIAGTEAVGEGAPVLPISKMGALAGARGAAAASVAVVGRGPGSRESFLGVELGLCDELSPLPRRPGSGSRPCLAFFLPLRVIPGPAGSPAGDRPPEVAQTRVT